MNDLLLREQARYDSDHPEQFLGCAFENALDQYTGRIQLRVAKAVIKVLKVDQMAVREEVLPDVAIYRSRLINLHELDPEVAMQTHGPRLYTRVTDAADYLGRASGNLAAYLDSQPGPLGDVSPAELILLAAQDLHGVTVNLGAFYDVEVEASHRSRLEQQAGISRI